MLKCKTVVLSILLICATVALGSTRLAIADDTPILGDVQKLQLSNKYLAYENAKLRLDAAQTDLVTFVQSLQKPGFTFDVGTGTYTPVPEKKDP